MRRLSGRRPAPAFSTGLLFLAALAAVGAGYEW